MSSVLFIVEQRMLGDQMPSNLAVMALVCSSDYNCTNLKCYTLTNNVKTEQIMLEY